MRSSLLKVVLGTFLIFSVSVAYAGDSEEYVIQQRNGHGDSDNYNAAGFNFALRTGALEVTRNDLDILFQNDGSLGTVQVVDNIGLITDLGEGSCSKVITNRYEDGAGGYPKKEDRKKKPVFWFEYSDAMTRIQDENSTPSLIPHNDHCYVVSKVTDGRHVIAAFHIKDLQPGKSMTINEVEVFKNVTINQDAADQVQQLQKQVQMLTQENQDLRVNLSKQKSCNTAIGSDTSTSDSAVTSAGSAK